MKEETQSPPAQSPHANHDIPFEAQTKNSQLLLTNIENPLPSVAALSQTTSWSQSQTYSIHGHWGVQMFHTIF